MAGSLDEGRIAPTSVVGLDANNPNKTSDVDILDGATLIRDCAASFISKPSRKRRYRNGYHAFHYTHRTHSKTERRSRFVEDLTDQH